MDHTLRPLPHNLQGPPASVVVGVVGPPEAYPKTGVHVAEAAMEEAVGRHEEPQLVATVVVALPETQMKILPTHHQCLALWPVPSMHLYAALWRQYLYRSLPHIQ
jgi:hypothetical protein